MGAEYSPAPPAAGERAAIKEGHAMQQHTHNPHLGDMRTGLYNVGYEVCFRAGGDLALSIFTKQLKRTHEEWTLLLFHKIRVQKKQKVVGPTPVQPY